MSISKDEAIEIANRELSRQEFNVKEKNIIIDENNSIWKERFLNDDKFIKSNSHIIEKLKNRVYWAIYYTSKETKGFFGGESWVFVDKATGEIVLLFNLK